MRGIQGRVRRVPECKRWALLKGCQAGEWRERAFRERLGRDLEQLSRESSGLVTQLDELQRELEKTADRMERVASAGDEIRQGRDEEDREGNSVSR